MEKILRYGTGTEADPFYAPDQTAGIQPELMALSGRGGILTLESGRYNIEKSIVFDTPCICLSGGVWACNTDPNGVFESKFGTKLRMHGTDYPAILVGDQCDPINGSILRDLGIQGDITGMNTKVLVDFAHPGNAAGLCFRAVRTDQCSFTKLSFCGLANAVTVMENAELDACTFENLNTDGCGNGFWFSPRASYYTRFRSCVVADTPYYGFYLGGNGKFIHNLEIADCYFVRNGGAFTEEISMQPAAVFFDHVSDCEVNHCIFDAPGTFWYYDPDATQNNQRQPSQRKTTALKIIGNKNRIRDNSFQNSSGDSIELEGDRNILIGNIVDGNVRIKGSGNTVVNLVFTTDNARLILEGNAKDTTVLQGVESWRLVKK